MQKQSNKQIDKLGKKLRIEDNLGNEELLEQLQNFRVSHKKALSQVFNIVCELGQKIRKDSIQTYRIKRIDSIIRKLQRLPNRQLSKMGDIGGCRCILKDDRQAYKLREELIKRFELRKEYDYIKTPKESGYRSIHLYLYIKEESRIIEVQIRNQEHHNWATLVEISDVLFDSGLKEYGRDKKLLNFHKLLSKKTKLNYSEMIQIARVLKEYNYIEYLSDVFTRNNTHVRTQWMKITNNLSHKFFLIESSKDDIPEIQSFENFSDSEEAYFEKYLKKSNSNLLLTHLPIPNYDKISVAYSNYLLTTHNFTNTCYSTLRILIKKSLQAGDIYKTLDFLSLYYRVNYNYSKNLIFEIKESMHYKSERKENSKKSKKEKAWDKKISRSINDIRTETIRLRKDLENIIVESFFKRVIIGIGISYLADKHDKRLQELITNTKL